MVTVEERRQATRMLLGRQVPQRRACRLVGLSRSSLHYHPVPRPYEQWLREYLREQAVEHPCWGYRRQWIGLRREGHPVNHKRIERLWKEEGLSLPRRRPKKRAPGPQGDVEQKAHYPNHVWSYDFAWDGLVGGRPLKILAVLDEFTRECLALVAARSIRSSAVIETLERLQSERGMPEYLRSDNGPELVAASVHSWLRARNTETIFITPGSPWENPYIESFIGKLRDECLSREWFRTVREANYVLNRWRREYNHRRPHSSLGYLTPVEMAQKSRGLTF